MNFFSKNKILTWLLLFLVAINLTILITFLAGWMRKSPDPSPQTCERSCNAICKQLTLAPDQRRKVDSIFTAYRSATQPLVAGIRALRMELLEELAKPVSDSAVIGRCTAEISNKQKELQQASVRQYLDLKKVCTPDQCRKLSSLYLELYGCQSAKGAGKMHQNRCGRNSENTPPEPAGCCPGK